MPIPNSASATYADQADPDSEDFRIVSDAHAGTGVGSGCACTPNASGSTLVVAVAAGTVYINKVAVTVAATTVTPGAANATNPRYDLVTVDQTGTVAIVAGTAAATPVFPIAPANRVVLCSVRIPATATSITAGNIIDKRQLVSYGQPQPLGLGNPYATGPELRQWRAAWANRELTPVNVLLVGDSNTVGYWANLDYRRWARILSDKLCGANNGQRAHLGWQPHHSLTNYTLSWTDVGTIADESKSGLGYGSVTIPGTGSSGSTTATQVCDRFWVFYSNGSGLGAFSVSIDGGTPVTITPTAVARSGAGGQAWDSGPLPRGLHTVKITSTTATASVIEGIQWFDGNANQAGAQGALSQANALTGQGVRVWNGAKFGAAAGDFAAAAASGTWWTDNLGVISPDVVFIAFGTNELAGAVSAATFRTNIVTIIDRINTVMAAASRPNPSYVLVVPMGTGATSTAIDPYRTAIYLAAGDRGCAVIDRQQFMGYIDTAAADPAGYGSSQDGASGRKHLSDTGHRAAGEHAADFLLEATEPKKWPPISKDDELRALRAAWAKRSTQPVNIVVLGDSVTQGFYATTFDLSLMRVLMSRLCQANGQPVPAGYVPLGTTALGAYTGRIWTMTNVSDNANYGIGYAAGTLAASGSGVATITAVCDRFWIQYPQAAAGLGAFSVSIDGVVVATITPTGTPARGGRCWDSGPLTRDSHTIRLTTTTATAAVVEGVYLFDSNGNSSGAQGSLSAANADTGAGVRLWNAAHFGYMASNYGTSPNGTNWWTDGFDTVSPDAIFIVLGVNDCTGTFTGFFHNDLVAIIQRVRSVAITNGQLHPSIVIVSPYGVGANSVDAMPPFRDMARQVAIEQGCGFLDLYPVMGYVGTAAADTYGLMSSSDAANNRIHPSDIGHQLIGDYLSGWILDALGPTGQIPRAGVRKVKAAGRTVADAVLNGTTTVTSATAAFVAGDVGKSVIGIGIPRGSTISTVNSGTSITITPSAATMSATAVTLSIMTPVTAASPATEDSIFFDCSAGPAEILIPNAVGLAGSDVTIKKVDNSANPVIAYTTGTSKIEDGTEIEIGVDGVALNLQADGTNWWAI